jgi:hypothetical protein
MLECGWYFTELAQAHDEGIGSAKVSDQRWWFTETGDRGRRKNKHAVDALASSAEEGRG